MRTFLRKIRKSLIGSGSARKYLFYAIGEILLVMVGILLALQVNNWNEWRKDRFLETEILQELKKTIEVNLSLLEHHIQTVATLNETSDRVVNIIQNDSTYSISYEQDFYYSFFSGTNIYLSNEGFEGLKNAGLEIIGNPVLKNAIVNLFGVKNVRIEQFTLFIKENFKVYESFLIQYFMTEELRLVPIDYNNLKQNPQFIAIIKRMKERRTRILENMKTNLEDHQNVLQLIIDELDQT